MFPRTPRIPLIFGIILLTIASTDACFGGQDTSCFYKCRCETSGCDYNTGSCDNHGGCDDGDRNGYSWRGDWAGPGCQIGNVAYGKLATQGPGSWVEVFQGTRYKNTADKSVDGNINPAITGDSCSHPAHGSSSNPAWWAVDLGSDHIIYNVTIVNRDSAQIRLQYTDVQYSLDNMTYTDCGGTESKGDIDQITIDCATVRARYIRLIRRSYATGAGAMNICEVMVTGYKYNPCSSGSYGPGCRLLCANCDCDDITGSCVGDCHPGWMGSDCTTPCSSSTWGANCNTNCNPACNVPCNSINGYCDDCANYFYGNRCEFDLRYNFQAPLISDKKPSSCNVEIQFWDNSGGTAIPDRYIIQYKVEGQTDWIDGEMVHYGGITKVEQGGLWPDTTYRFRYQPVFVDYKGRPSMETDAFRTAKAATVPTTTTEKPKVGPVTKQPGGGSGGGPNGGLIGGIVFVVIAAIVLTLVVIFFVRRRRKNANKGDTKPLKPTPPPRPTITIVRNEEDKGEYNPSFVPPTPPPAVKPAAVEEERLVTTPPDVIADEPSEPTGIKVEHRPIKVDDLPAYIEEKKAKVDGFKDEYGEIPAGPQARWEVGNKPENKNKNRFLNIRAYDHSRVILDKIEDDFHSDYVNASYVPGLLRGEHAYIASQGPKKVNLADMWRLIWQLNMNRVVMVTHLVEGGRNKCEQYWPAQGSSQYGDVTVKLVKAEEFSDCIIRILTAEKEGESRTIRQFHFTGWPDKSVPLTATSLLEFRRKVRSYDADRTGPLMVHCSAGVGRTGTFIAIDNLLDQARQEGEVDVFGYTLTMRQQRVNMIQTLDQYVFVYDALLEALRSGDTAIPCPNFEQELKNLKEVNTDTGKNKLQEQFEVLSVLRPPKREEDLAGTQDKNIDKNRSQDIIPSNRVRPYLQTKIDGTTDYINAVYVDGYKARNAYILTQTPLPDTVVDLWRLLYDHRSRTVIMLSDVDPDVESVSTYWPEETETPLMFGPLSAELLQTDDSTEDITVRDIKLTHAKKAKTTTVVKQFQLTCWPKDSELPSNPGAMLQMLEMVERWQQQSGNTPITIHCLNGCSRSGIYCALSYIVENLKLQEVDIFQAVKRVRLARPQLIESIEQYEYLHDMALQYMDRYATYSNFR